MRISLVSVNYAPEKSGIAPYSTGLAVGLASRWHDVEVLTSLPHYPEWHVDPAYRDLSGTAQVIDGVIVRRLAHYIPNQPTTCNRMAFEASFGLRVVSKRWNKPQVVLTTSPCLIASAMVIARSKAMNIPVGVIVQDLYGKGVAETGAMSGRMVLAATWFEAAVLGQATGTAVIHDRFAGAATRMGVDPTRVTVIRNWAHIDVPGGAVTAAEVRKKYGWSPDERIVVHSGNMGAKQGLENVVAAARLADKRRVDIRFVLIGDGNQRSALEREARGVQRLEFRDPLETDGFREVLASADVLLVNERPSVGEMAVPSKLTSYFSAARPVLAATDVNGITAGEIRDSGGGVVVPAADPPALLDAAVALADDIELGHRLGQSGRQYAGRMLGGEQAIDKYEEWCHRLLGNRANRQEIAPVGRNGRSAHRGRTP